MKEFLEKVKDNCIAGAALLIPMYVFYLILKKVWIFFEKYGEMIAKLFGLDQIFGRVATDVLGGIILLIMLYFSGYLVRLAFLKQFSQWLDNMLLIYLPGYEKHRKLAHESLTKKSGKAGPQYPPILLKQGDYWQPAFLVDEEMDGRIVVFVPNAPFKDQGQIYVVDKNLVKEFTETTTVNLEEAVKVFGKGILKFK